jgi:hypothetical protein
MKRSFFEKRRRRIILFISWLLKTSILKAYLPAKIEDDPSWNSFVFKKQKKQKNSRRIKRIILNPRW